MNRSRNWISASLWFVGSSIFLAMTLAASLAVAQPRYAGSAACGGSCNGCHVEWSKEKAGYEAGVAAFKAKFGN